VLGDVRRGIQWAAGVPVCYAAMPRWLIGAIISLDGYQPHGQCRDRYRLAAC